MKLQDRIVAAAPTPAEHTLRVEGQGEAVSIHTDLDHPMLTMKRSAVEHNIRLMADYCARRGVELCPHGKTSMMPWLFEQQLEAGAWGLTAATPTQLRSYRALGVRRILLANVLVDPAAIEWIARDLREHPEVEFICYVDSLAAVEILSRTLAHLGDGFALDVLIELGYEGGRSGARSPEDAAELASAVAASPHLRLRGVSGFEGFFRVSREASEERSCRAYLEELRELTEELYREGRFAGPPILSIAGSSYFDVALEHLAPECFSIPVTVVLRSGCYVAHDSVMYAEVSPLAGRRPEPSDEELRAALELWATVWSLPEPGLAIVGFGRRDAPYDHSMPVLLRGYREQQALPADFAAGSAVIRMDDQHAYLRYEAADSLRVGDTLVFGISHPCGAFDRWRWIPVLSDRGRVELVAGTLF